MGVFNGCLFSWSFLLAQLVIIIISICVGRRFFSPISDIPGPFVASFTRLWHIRRILKIDQNLKLIRHFVRIAHNEVSVSHPDAVKKLLLAPLHKGSWYKVVTFPDGRFQNPMSATDPKVKNKLSRHLAPGFVLSNMLLSEQAINQTIHSLLGWLSEYAESGKPINLNEYFSFTISDIVGEAIFSKPFGFIKGGKDIGNSVANAEAHSAYIAVAGYFRWLHVLLLANPVVTWLGILPAGYIIDFALRSTKERESNPDARFDALAHWFRMLEQSPDRIQRHEIDSGAFNSVAAGFDTVSSALQAFVYYMIRHSNAWQRVRDEIDAAGLKDGVVSYVDTQRLPFLQACIKETLRIFGPVPMGLPRLAPEGGIIFGNREFPKGTVLSVNAWVMHHSKEIWGSDARQFNPNRWLGNDSIVLEKFLMPFGAGYAACPGQNLAKIELSKITAMLVRDYDIRQVDPSQKWKWNAFFTLAPHSWPCYITKRKRQ
ncbi:benzoate 4-monooxygenase cytochrome P450 [Pseudomassariella vexata]|uniref:Benzoate 4-monooxygenase cytochrome P450 n=1 Tax=Pseudomassariella vexata TaxID=1141098 RepID=A0A1Y2E6B6_9PEZI|nr:benzoate 4-monooxygenase cytochrome P450 [Pseudomassariella vexata]ORY67113.1 benzoate 4-monooxygenase cytochrome P450 [Pseudomassariella vexata]